MQINRLTKVRRVSREGEYRANCPYCADTKQHFYFNISSKVFHCFKCGISGKLVGDSLVDIGDRNVRGSGDTKILPPKDIHIDYLIKRGLTLEEVLHFTPVSIPEYPNYVFSGRYQSEMLVGRTIVSDNEPKYIQIGEKRLYGDIENGCSLIIVEGMFDYYAVRRVTPHVVALLGKEINPKQFTHIACIRPKDISILLDSDAMKMALILLKKLKTITSNVRILTLNDGDPWDHRDDLKTLIGEV